MALNLNGSWCSSHCLERTRSRRRSRQFSDTINSETLGESIALTSNQVKYSPIYEALGGNGVKAA
ncbi:hypothetical protein V2J09_004125 [Rumex salicifolius]